MGFAGLVVAADQVTKHLALTSLAGDPLALIPGWLSLRLTYNSGGAFGFMQGAPGFFLVAGLAIFVLILMWVGRLEDDELVLPLALVLGGGIGNLTDRVLRDFGGGVVDFIDLSFWPTFNVADTAIVFGVILIFATGVRGTEAGDDA